MANSVVSYFSLRESSRVRDNREHLVRQYLSFLSD